MINIIETKESLTEPKTETVYTDVIAAAPNSPHNSFLYNVILDKNKFIATVIGQSATGAKAGLQQQFPNATLSYLGKSTFIMQLNG